MKTRNTCLVTALTMLLGTAAAHAGSIRMTASDGSENIMRSGDLSSMFGGTPDHEFLNANMNTIHNMLHSSGITTDGLITVMLADTADGLGFITLLDDNTAHATGGGATWVSMDSTAPNSAEYWINDSWQDAQNRIASGVEMNVGGAFGWTERRGGDGFAWTSLAEGDEVGFDWSFMSGAGLASGNQFQFLNWGDNGWEVVNMGAFDGQGNYAFAFTVVPLPAPLLMGLAGLGGVAAIRRRRNRA